MKKLTALLAALIICFTACGTNGNDTQPRDGKIYLTSAAAVGQELAERKAYLRNAFDYSKYNKTTVTLIPKSESPLAIDDNRDSSDCLYGVTDEGTHLFYKNTGDDFAFSGKYILCRDIPDGKNYKAGERFIIYHEDELPRTGDVSGMNVVSVVAENEENLIETLTDSINNYLEKTRGFVAQQYSVMSIEEAVLDIMQKNGIDPEKFYQQKTSCGGVYYTDGNTSYTCKVNVEPPVPGVDGRVVFAYNVVMYEGAPEKTKEPITSNLLFVK